MAEPFYTVGHSNRTISEFVDLLKEADISFVADVRSIPKSRANPQYNRDVLPQALCAFQIGYEHIAALGGRRARSHAILPEVNAFWDNQSFHNYADYAMSDEFHSGFAKLRGVAQTARCAIMCAEVLWWRCHRRIIADYLIAAGTDVLHILGLHKFETAQITKAARVGSAGMLTYPSAKQGENRDAGAIAASRP